jgi:hypothetical protein
MKAPMKFRCYFLPIVFFIAGCSQSGPSITDEEVVVSLKQMDVHFDRAWDFSDTYMVFGGGDLSRTDTINKISISGISMEDVISIHRIYPDFHKCNSPGAALAKKALLHLNIIPVDSKVLKKLKGVLSQHEKNLHNGGDRICVKLEGEILEMTNAFLRKNKRNITRQLPSQMRRDYFLVQSADIIESDIVLEDS